MADQYDDISRLLGKMGLSPDWHVVEPVRGDLKSMIWIQNAKAGLNVMFPLGPTECDDLKDDEKERAHSGGDCEGGDLTAEWTRSSTV